MIGSRLFAFLFIISPILATNPCLAFIDQLELNKNAPHLQTPQEKAYFAYSGTKGMNDLGRKTKCERDSSRRFYVIGEISPGDGTAYSEIPNGICVPDFCDKQVLEPYPTLLKLCRINNWEPKGPSLVLNDPNATPSRGGGFYVLVAIFYVLIALCVISTLVQNQDKILKLLKKDPGQSSSQRFSWFFKAFDVIGNVKSLYKTAQESGQSDHLAVFGILRTCSMLWVAATHTFGAYSDIFKASGEWPDSPPFIVNFFIHGTTAVGLFFFMGGFLAAYTLPLKASREKITVWKFFSDFLHRLYKIYPGFWASVLLEWIVVPGMLKGPMANKHRGRVQVCGDRWIQKLFMIDNLMDPRCAMWTWYLDADIQLYIAVILLSYLFVAKKNSKMIGYLVTFIMIGVCLASGFLIIKYAPHNNWYYYPFPRGVQVLIGVFFGFQYYEYSKLKLTNNFCAWCEKNIIVRFISMALGLACVIIGVVTFEADGAKREFGNGVLITLGAALFFVPLMNNCTSIIKQFFNLRIFQVFGKLGMGFYLLHNYFVEDAMAKIENLQVEYSFEVMMYAYNKVIMFAYLCAFLYHLVLEKPLLNIEAHYLRRQRSNKPPASIEPVTPSCIDLKHEASPGISDSPVDKGQQVSQDMEASVNVQTFAGASSSTALVVDSKRLVGHDVKEDEQTEK